MAGSTFVERAGKAAAKRRAAREDARRLRSFSDNPVLSAIKPREGYVFHDDYIEVDGGVMCVLTFWHNAAGRDNFGRFWGINLFPDRAGADIGDDVEIINIEQVSRMDDRWVDERRHKASNVAEKNANEQATTGNASSNRQAAKDADDIQIIDMELANQASYLHVQARMIIKAPDVATMDRAIDRITERYADTHVFTTIKPVTHDGAMREELGNIWSVNSRKRGHGAYYTSTEYAGEYNLVTHGIEDARGTYVGTMTGDVNNSAVLLDVDGFSHHVVVATAAINQARGRVRASDMWATKLAQAALMDGHRVTQVLLAPSSFDVLGPAMPNITQVMDLNRGAVNMFHFFGEPGTEFRAFPAQMEKIKVMTEQAATQTESDRSIVRGQLEELLVRFYHDYRMWPSNPERHRDEIRILGLPREQYPRLQDFVAWVSTAYDSAVRGNGISPDRLHALEVLNLTFKNFLQSDADIFNAFTDPGIEHVGSARRLAYDFSSLAERGQGIAMAQLVNVIDLVCAQMGEGDLVIFQHADAVDRGVREYVGHALERLFSRGGRVALCYDSVEAMVDAASFNRFDEADYTLLGNMTETVMGKYRERLGREMPETLTRLICDQTRAVMYCRRGPDNVVFNQDLPLGDEASLRRRGGGGTEW